MITSRTWRPAGGNGHAAFAAFAAAAAAVLAAGCATVPTSGPVQQVGAGQSGVSQEQTFSQPIPVGPGPGWSPTQIVSGFLAASASFANDHAVAREYLDSTAQQIWQPGWAVTVVSTTPTASPAPVIPKPLAGLARVRVTGLPVATLTGTGQYLMSSGRPPSESYFSLIKINGQWRINDLPASQLLLTQADFQRVYQSRDLYFLSQSGGTLVPDPVLVPQQATNTELATGLVKALLAVPAGWLSGAASTGFPARARLLGQVKINGPNATVDLGGSAAAAGQRQLAQMAAQLAWTLASGPAAIQSVELEVNGRPLQIRGSQYQLPQTYRGWVPSQPAGTSLYFVGGGGAVQALSGAGQPGAQQPGRVSPVPGMTGLPALAAVAVSPDQRSVAAISAGGGIVYTGGFARGAAMRQWRPPSGSCTSLSWDAQGDLWVTAGGEVWMLPPGGASAEPVTLDDLSPGAGVTDFRVAPDGVRAIMIVHGLAGGKPATQVQLAAITRDGPVASVGRTLTIGAGISDPQAVSWYGADDVIVLAAGASGAQLFEVPLNGGQSTAVAITGDPVSVTATSPQGATADIAVGLASGKIVVSTNLGTFEPTSATGQAPAYPG